MILRLLLLATATLAHISLKYPPVRYPPLDFLDNVHTQQPCGVPRPPVPRYTDLNVGETYNISWRMQYPTKGGLRLTLMDESGKLIQKILPASETSNFTDANNDLIFATQFRPSKPCEQCIIRIEQQALENGSSYEFYSCADINILETEPNIDDLCSGNGIYKDGECVCKHLYSGDVCQFKDDCSSDDDCQHDGSCVEQTNSLTNRVCYCAYGYYGVNCEKKMLKTSKDDLCFNYESSLNKSFNNYGLFNADCYKTHTLNEDDRIYTRVVGNELELIMDYKTASWIAVGWRPLEISKFCRLFPDLENIRWKRDMETNNTSATASEETFVDESFSNETQSEEMFVNETDSSETYRLRPVPQAKQPKDNGFLISALTAELNPMDCTDIITASVIDGRLRINDMYSRDRSTPLVDTWLDGEESLTAAYGIERDGRTVVMFRREISEIEPSDHPLGPGKIFVIYAKGQESMTGDIPKNNHSKSDLHQHYRNDELNYHGTNRGALTLEFVSNDEYKRPKFWSRTNSLETSSESLNVEKSEAKWNNATKETAEDVKDSVPSANIPKESEKMPIPESDQKPEAELENEPKPESAFEQEFKPEAQPTSKSELTSKFGMAVNIVPSKDETSPHVKTELESKSQPEFEAAAKPESASKPELAVEPGSVTDTELNANLEESEKEVKTKWSGNQSERTNELQANAPAVEPTSQTSAPTTSDGQHQAQSSTCRSTDISLFNMLMMLITLMLLFVL